MCPTSLVLRNWDKKSPWRTYYYYCSTPLYEILMMLSRFEAPLYTSLNLEQRPQKQQQLLWLPGKIVASSSNICIETCLSISASKQRWEISTKVPLYQQSSTVMLMHTGYVFDQTIFCFKKITIPFQISFSSYWHHSLSKIDFRDHLLCFFDHELNLFIVVIRIYIRTFLLSFLKS